MFSSKGDPTADIRSLPAGGLHASNFSRCCVELARNNNVVLFAQRSSQRVLRPDLYVLSAGRRDAPFCSELALQHFCSRDPVRSAKKLISCSPAAVDDETRGSTECLASATARFEVGEVGFMNSLRALKLLRVYVLLSQLFIVLLSHVFSLPKEPSLLFSLLNEF